MQTCQPEMQGAVLQHHISSTGGQIVITLNFMIKIRLHSMTGWSCVYPSHAEGCFSFFFFFENADNEVMVMIYPLTHLLIY